VLLVRLHVPAWATPQTMASGAVDLVAAGFILLGVALALAVLLVAWVCRCLRVPLAVNAGQQASLEPAPGGRLATIGVLAGGLAHEINNPLSVLTIEQSNLEDDVASLPAVGELRQRVLESIERCRRQIQRCSEASRRLARLGRDGERRPEVVVVGKTLGELQRLLRAIAQQRKVDVQLDVQPNTPDAWVDAGELDQVLVAFISMWIQNSPPQTRLRLEASGSANVVEILLAIGSAPEGQPGAHPSVDALAPTISACRDMVSGWGGSVDIRAVPAGGVAVALRLPAAHNSGAGATKTL